MDNIKNDQYYINNILRILILLLETCQELICKKFYPLPVSTAE